MTDSDTAADEQSEGLDANVESGAESSENAESSAESDENPGSGAESMESAESGTESRTTTDSGGEDEWVESVPDGAGCTEIWDHLSEQREAGGDD